MHLFVRPWWFVQHLKLDVPHAVISISDPGKDPAPIPDAEGRREILRLQFIDADRAKISSQFSADLFDQCMTADHARQIWDLIDRHPDLGAIVVHCEAGISRSPSVAKAIADTLGVPRTNIDWPGQDVKAAAPNPWVYRVVTEVRRRMYSCAPLPRVA